MLKQQHTYEDFNGDTVTEVLYFNLTKVELAENMWIKDKVDKLMPVFEGPERELKGDEVAKILEVIKDFMKLSYGVKSDDGKRFVKSDQLWTEFTQSAAYDGFLFSLFETPEKANAFILGVMPKELAEAAEKMQIQKVQGSTPSVQQIDEVQLPSTPVETPIKEKDPKDMTREELLAAMKERNAQ